MKNCLDCGIQFTPTGANHKRCSECGPKAKLRKMNEWYYKHKIPGPGSGPRFYEDGGRFTHGLGVFRRWAKEKLQQLNYCCERCGKHIDAKTRGTWAGHHKDHNRSNNVKDNLEVLCKQCHQIEHECWRAFQGVTTIPKGSTHENVEAHSTL